MHLAEARPAGAAVGPVLSWPSVYDPRSAEAELGAMGKNLGEQVQEKPGPVGLWMVVFLMHFAAGAFDACCFSLGRTPSSPQEVIAAAYLRSGAKGRQYSEAFRWFYDGVGFCKAVVVYTVCHVSSMFVKVEALASGKPPRMIFNPLTWEVVVSLESTRPAEGWMKQERVTFKGVQTADKWKPIAEAALKVNAGFDVWILCLDDTGRDSNTVAHDFTIFECVLAILGCLTIMTAQLLQRVGFRAKMNNFKLRGDWVSLLSGSSWTSVMNYFTSMFMLFCVAVFYLDLPFSDFYCLAEGDDSALILSGERVRGLLQTTTLFDEEGIAGFGLKLRKRLKIESFREFYHPEGHPIVGGVAAFSCEGSFYHPSWKRFELKTSWALSFMICSEKVYLSRLQSRSLCLNDRFDGVPIMWAYARRVAIVAQRLGGRALLDSDELFTYGGIEVAYEPSMASRISFSTVYGINVSRQLAMEEYFFRVADFHDLSVDPYWRALH